MTDFKSPNFEFLKDTDPALTRQAAMAEQYCLEDPNAALTKLRLFGEMLAKNIAARYGVYADDRSEQSQILRELKYQDILDQKLADMFHSIRTEGNAAVHEGKGTVRDAVLKITGKSDQPLQLIRRYKNERLPNVAVTVDLLTTGIDVLSICNIVFIRKVSSRILYEQMLGRATRRCDEISKEVFRIFDAVDICSTMQGYSDMKPVVNRLNITFAKLEKEIVGLRDEAAQQTAKNQFIAKLQRKKRLMDKQGVRDFETRTGMKPDQFIARLSDFTTEEAGDWFVRNPGIGELLDMKGRSGPFYMVVSDHEDEVTDVSRKYGKAVKPADYIEGFAGFVEENINKIAGLKLAVQRPGELTRKQLRELQLNLEANGYREQDLKTAYKAAANADIAANIMGFVRQAALGDPLMPYEQRVDEAVNKILGSREWSRPQQQWLQRIAAQMKKEIIVDQESMNKAQFREAGGFKRINKIFNGELSQILEDITEQVWEKRA